MLDWLVEPFNDPAMRQALVATLALSLGCAPIGVFLALRRMTLMGDAMSHAILPGVAVAFIFFGASLWPMTIGGFVVALLVALVAGFISRTTTLKEDTSFGAMYLISLAAGVVIVSLHGESDELMHMLFGDIFSMARESFLMVASISSATLMLLAIMYRPLILECVDNVFLQSVRGRGTLWYMLFLVLVSLNLVAGFQALGTLMTLGLIILPAACTNFWCRDIDRAMGVAVAIAWLACGVGLLVSFHYKTPSGASIVLAAGGFYVLSILVGNHNSLRAKLLKHRHLKA